MNARVALSVVVLSLLASLPSPTSQANVRVIRRADPPWARPSSNNFYGPPGKNKGPPGGGGPPGQNGGGPPGQNGGGPPGQNGGGPPGQNGGGPPGLNGGGPPGLSKPGKGHGKPQKGNGHGSQERPDDNERPDENVQSTTDSNRQPWEDKEPKRCGPNEFQCGSKECLPSSVRCDNRIDCQDSSDEFNCIVNRNGEGSCVLPEQPKGGSYELGGCGKPCIKQPGDSVPKHSILTYTCRDNYVLTGNSITVCVDGEWLNPPSCAKTCSPLKSSTVDVSCNHQGKVVSCTERIVPGTRATLSCKSSYKLPVTNDPGYREIQCLEDGLWNRQMFRCLAECGTAIAQGNALIVNGINAKVGIFPWHVGIYRKNSETEYEQICAGTLISNNLVVSAAHCFFDEVYGKAEDKSKYFIAAGKHYRDWNNHENYAQKSPLSELLLPQRYLGIRGNFAQDIALAKLETPFQLTSLVQPICMDWDNEFERQQLQVGQMGKVVGWGKTITGKPSETLQELNMPFIPYDQCVSAVPDDFRGYITSDKFCAGWLNGSSLCDGDSGGGLGFQMHGTWYLRGVVSVSPVKGDQCDNNYYVAFTYTSYFRDWIRDAYVTF